jgi:proline iminopeptidase
MSIAGFVEDIELLRQAMELDRIDVLGHSWGGLLAMHYAIQYPDHLRSLILSNSIPAATEPWQEEEAQLAQRISPADSLQRWTIINSGQLQNDPAGAVKELMLLSFKTQFHDPGLLDSLSLWIPDDFMARSQVFQLLGPDLASFDLYDDLAKVETPTLIIYGDQEPAATLSGKHLADLMPKAELVIIKDSGHFPFVEQKGAYLAAIQNFLDGHK